MKRAIAYEVLRLRTVRSTWGLIIGSVALSAVTVLAMAAMVRDLQTRGQYSAPPVETATLLLTRSPFPALGAGLIGVLAFGGDNRFGTIVTTALVTPRRSVVLAARVVVIGIVGAILALLGLAVAWLIGGLMIGGSMTGGAPAGELIRLQIGQLIVVLGWAMAGLALGCLIRNQTAAVLALVGLPFVLEPILRSVLGALPGWGGTLAHLMPFSASTSLVTVDSNAVNGLFDNGPGQLSPLLGGLVFIGSVVAALLFANALHSRRDLVGR